MMTKRTGRCAWPRCSGIPTCTADYGERAASSWSYWHDLVQHRAGGATGVTFVAAANDALIGITNVVCSTSGKLKHSASMHGVYVQAAWCGAGIADALVP